MMLEIVIYLQDLYTYSYFVIIVSTEGTARKIKFVNVQNQKSYFPILICDTKMLTK